MGIIDLLNTLTLLFPSNKVFLINCLNLLLVYNRSDYLTACVFFIFNVVFVSQQKHSTEAQQTGSSLVRRNAWQRKTGSERRLGWIAMFMIVLEILEGSYDSRVVYTACVFLRRIRNQWTSEHIAIIASQNYKNKTHILTKWNFPLRRISSLFISVCLAFGQTDTRLFLETWGKQSPKAWTEWTYTQLHDVTRCPIWIFSKDNNLEMINASGKSPRGHFLRTQIHVLVENCQNPLGMKSQTKQLWVHNRKLNPESNSAPPHVWQVWTVSSFLFLIWRLVVQYDQSYSLELGREAK